MMLNVLIASGNLVWFLFYVEVGFPKELYNNKFFINIFPIFFVISVHDVEILIPLDSLQFMLSSYI